MTQNLKKCNCGHSDQDDLCQKLFVIFTVHSQQPHINTPLFIIIIIARLGFTVAHCHVLTHFTTFLFRSFNLSSFAIALCHWRKSSAIDFCITHCYNVISMIMLTHCYDSIAIAHCYRRKPTAIYFFYSITTAHCYRRYPTVTVF